MELKDILSLKPGLYSGQMGEEKIVIKRKANDGFEIMHAPSSNGWCEVVLYNEAGEREGQTCVKSSVSKPLDSFAALDAFDKIKSALKAERSELGKEIAYLDQFLKMSANFNLVDIFRAEKDKKIIEKIIDRAAELNLLNMNRIVANAFLQIAKEHYDLDLKKLLHSSTFDFAHDFVYMPKHYHPETGEFDGYFLPRSSKKNFGED